jgi:hypothetical protein
MRGLSEINRRPGGAWLSGYPKKTIHQYNKSAINQAPATEVT